MPTTYQSGLAQSNTVPRGQPGPTVISRTAKFTLTAALAVNDVIQMIPVFAGEKVLEVFLNSPDLDTNGSPAIVLDVGDGDTVDRYIDGSTVGQAGGKDRADAAYHPYEYAADDTIDIKVAVGPGTGATTGTIELVALISKQG